jgi:hypothetical protein
MQASELIHLAALIAAHGTLPEGDGHAIPSASLGNYWLASKSRLDRWYRALRPRDRGASPRLLTGQWKALRPLIEEILLSEILTRVWTGFLVACDHSQGRDEAEPLARSVLSGHLEARQRALSLLLHATGVPIADAVAINQLRRKADRWTDLLLGYLAPRCDLSDLAADAQRVRDFALDWQDAPAEGAGPRWSLLMASLQDAFPIHHSARGLNADLNERIAASILACFPSEAFDSTGLFHSLWMVRLRYAADSLVESLDSRA